MGKYWSFQYKKRLTEKMELRLSNNNNLLLNNSSLLHNNNSSLLPNNNSSLLPNNNMHKDPPQEQIRELLGNRKKPYLKVLDCRNVLIFLLNAEIRNVFPIVAVFNYS